MSFGQELCPVDWLPRIRAEHLLEIGEESSVEGGKHVWVYLFEVGDGWPFKVLPGSEVIGCKVKMVPKQVEGKDCVEVDS